MKKIFIIGIICLCSGNIFAQQFEGEIILESRDSSGKVSRLEMYKKDDLEKMLLRSNNLPVEVYITKDSLTLVVPSVNYALKMGRDSAVVFFEKTTTDKSAPDSLVKLTPTSRKKIISGFHCACYRAVYLSGIERELWITSEVDYDICMAFSNSFWWNYWQSKNDIGSFLKELHKNGKFVIFSGTIGDDGKVKNRNTVIKLSKHHFADDEFEMPSNMNLFRLNPQQFLDGRKKSKE